MRPTKLAILCSLTLPMIGCASGYHPASINHGPSSVQASLAQVNSDPELDGRYPGDLSTTVDKLPAGAHTPAPRPDHELFTAAPQNGWAPSRLQREAERKSIARDMPFASVEGRR